MPREKLNTTAARYRRAVANEREAMEHMLQLAPEERVQARQTYQAAARERERAGQELLDAGKDLPPV